MLSPGTGHPALAAVTITVNSTGDSGACTVSTMTLRCALIRANLDGSGDTIRFSIPITDPGCSGTPLVCMIQPATSLPSLTASNTTIDGYTQVGASPNSLPLAPFPNPLYSIPVGTAPGAYGSNARIVIQLDGSLAPCGTTNGLTINNQNNTIRGLSITNFCGDGIFICCIGAGGNKIQGNFLGPLPNGREAGDHAGNSSNGNGVEVESVTGAPTLIGGTLAATTNLISGNRNQGVHVHATAALIQRNLIGTDRTGTVAVSNGNNGILLEDAHDVTVGGSTYLTRNLLSGNGTSGSGTNNSGIREVDSDRTTITGNFAGTDVTGLVTLANNSSGIELNGGRHTTIGGPATASINVISGNNYEGVNADTEEDLRIQNNFIGVDVTGKRELMNDYPGLLFDDLNTTDTNAVCTVTNPHCHPALILHNTVSSLDDDSLRTHADWGDVFKGNLIGTDNLGRNPLPGFDDNLNVELGSYTVIGGTSPGDGNVIANALYDNGIDLEGSNHTTIQGNNIGTDITGTVKMGNGTLCPHCDEGIEVRNYGSSTHSSFTTIGGTNPHARNLIDNNGDDGVHVTNASNTTIQGNWIGLGSDGHAMGNGSHGVEFINASGTNLVGGTAAGAANRIAYNALAGVAVEGSSSHVAIRANSIFQNGDLGIDLQAIDAVNCGGTDGAAPTPNGGQLCPVITGASTSNVHGTDAVDGDRVDVFVATNEADDTNPGGGLLHGEGMTYLGTATVSGGAWSLPVGLGKLNHGSIVTATSTGGVAVPTPDGTDTSEFAQNVKVP
jgi:hypothetical protein